MAWVFRLPRCTKDFSVLNFGVAVKAKKLMLGCFPRFAMIAKNLVFAVRQVILGLVLLCLFLNLLRR